MFLASKLLVIDYQFRRIVSGGLDGKVKISQLLDDPSPLEHVIGERINAIVCRGDTIILATEGTYVHMIQAEDGLPDGVATRFTAEVNDLATNKDMSKLVSCSSDFMIKIVDFNNSVEREFVLEGHKAPVLSVSIDPLDIFIASSSCDGTIRIWRVDQRKEVKCVRALSPCSDPTLALSCCRLCWQSISGQVT
ncbi:WD repeat and HMG box DNA binding protein 1 [Fasciolopsis buskii]|uniref:WD repeat and HMG box DNA binding protein 1 n=1 Tax=Fasciolopsis buskii TaxID=27845 RepID=A0A8E0RTG0_9TREM|nr:WD repeat and HMG box DNA binding protein 1 [Fasciolopsis buski]